MHTTANTKNIRTLLRQISSQSQSNPARFFKTRPGDYSEHDQFIGVPVPELRIIANKFHSLTSEEIIIFLNSDINEERLLALLIMVNQYQCQQNHTHHATKNETYKLYINSLKKINNWNLVDASAHLIIGAHIFQKNTAILHKLITSKNMWERRIAIVATWHFIKNDEFNETISLAKMVLNDTADLIHKSTGWMLREMGKRDEKVLLQFLDEYAHIMPRTMLRYALEKLQPSTRSHYLKIKRSKKESQLTVVAQTTSHNQPNQSKYLQD